MCHPPTSRIIITSNARRFTYLVDLGSRYSIGYLSFATARDVLPSSVISTCPCEVTDPSQQLWCDFVNLYRTVCQNAGQPPWGCEATIKLGGTMGVRDIKGAAKQPLFNALQTARAAPLETTWMGGAGGESVPSTLTTEQVAAARAAAVKPVVARGERRLL